MISVVLSHSKNSKSMKVIKPAVISKTSEKSRQWPQLLAVLSAAFLAIGSGFQNGWPSPSVPKLLSGDMGFEISEEETSYVVMISPLGYLIGSPLAGFLLDRIGRKYTLLLLAIPEILPWVLIAFANNVAMLCVARFIMGIADGALFSSLPVYMGEVLEPKIRGIVGTSHSLGILTGNLFINVYGSYVPMKIAACISLSVPLFFLVTFIWMPESPYYLVMKDRTNDSRKSLQKLRRMKNVEDELTQITSDVQRQISEPGNLRDIFTIRSNLKAFTILLGLRTFQQLSGITALSFYLQFIFQQASNTLTPAESAIICYAVQLLVTFCTALFVDRLGRRPLFMFSTSMSAALLITVGLYFSFQRNGYDMTYVLWLPVIGMVLYNVFCAMGVLMIPNLMAGEILSASVKSKALGLINMCMGLAVSATSKLFQWLDHDFGMHVPFFVFGTCCILGAVFCYFYIPETKGKTLEEIQQVLKGNAGSETNRSNLNSGNDENSCSNRY